MILEINLTDSDEKTTKSIDDFFNKLEQQHKFKETKDD